ncbi:MAG: DNA repair protein RecO [Eubacteriales bacterium]
MEFATNGIITRVYDVGASDKMLNIITQDRGRIGVMVKGGRSPSSKLRSVSQLFTYANFEISQKGNLYWLRSGSVINPFYDLSIDIVRVSLASYLCDLANELTDEGGEDDSIMRLLLNSLYLLGRGAKDQRIIKAVFEMRAAAISGYCPELSFCAYCREPFSEFTYLDVMGGKLICTDCLAKRGDKKIEISKEFEYVPEASILCGLSPSALAALRYIVTSPDGKIFSFELKDDGETEELARAAESYILNHLERNFDSLTFYKQVK